MSTILFKRPPSNNKNYFSLLPPGVSVNVGFDIDHEPIDLPFNYENYLVAGDSSDNRTILLHNLILNGCAAYSPRELLFRLADCKQGGHELDDYTKNPIPHIECVRTNVTPRDLFEFFKEAEILVQERSKHLSEARARHTNRYILNIDEYNKVAAEVEGLEPIVRTILVVNDVQQAILDCMGESTANSDAIDTVTAQDLTNLIVNVASRGYFVGVFIVLLADSCQVRDNYIRLRDNAPYCADRILFRLNRILFRTTAPDTIQVLLRDIHGDICTEELNAVIPTLPDSDCLYLKDHHQPFRLHTEEISPQERQKTLAQIRDKYSL